MMDIPVAVEVILAKESSSSSVDAVVQTDVPSSEVKVPITDKKDIGDIMDIEPMTTTSSDLDIGTAESCSPNEHSKDSSKTVVHYPDANVNGNITDLHTEEDTEAKVEAKLAIFREFEDEDDLEAPLATLSESSPSIHGNYSSSEASCSNLPAPDGPELSQHGHIVSGPNIDCVIRKQYLPSLHRTNDDLSVIQHQLPISENPWEFRQTTAVAVVASSSSHAVPSTSLGPKSTCSVGIQVYNPEIGNLIMPYTECDWISCMICALIVTCITTGLCAGTVMILNSFFQYWSHP